MMKQYLEIKDRCRDAILFFRLGDFYEMFFDDAVDASKILEITLTARNKNDENPVPLCGIPYHAASSYIAKLIEHGRKVAICDQVEDPKEAKGIVKRDITRIITPGLVIDEGTLSAKDTNYLASACLRDKTWGLSFLDLSTGDFRMTELPFSESPAGLSLLWDELLRIDPKELLISDAINKCFTASDDLPLNPSAFTNLDDDCFDIEEGRKRLLEHFRLQSLDGLGCASMTAGLGAASAILAYIGENQNAYAGHVDRLRPYHTDSFMHIDAATKRNLELTSTMLEENKKGSLLQVLDFTETAMGGRRLKEWINYPLQDAGAINDRLDGVAEFKDAASLRREVRELLGGIYDLERLNGRVSMGRANPRDMIALGNSLKKLPHVKKLLEDFNSKLLQTLSSEIDPVEQLELLIDSAIEEAPPINIKEGGIICRGFNSELDELRQISSEGKTYLTRMELQEKERTGISSLKVRYNKVFGYYIEVTKTNLALVPDNYIRKQTLSNAERYITPELKEYEAKILGAEDKIEALEYEIFASIREKAASYSKRLRDTADALSSVDVLCSLGETADRFDYVRPEVSESGRLKIVSGRHPVVERLNPEDPFVPNDTCLDSKEDQLIIITGPNMAGKSTYIRQVAVLTLMAHMGSFVPADSAEIGIVDRIFTRVGASDNLAKGQSTFMVEMNETSNILNNATGKSLIILDEIGRGTSTFDGVSIAWAVAEYIHDSPGLGAKTLFATHYHELTELALTKERVKNYNVAVKEWNDSIIFLRKIVEGGASRSYGIEVARLAGLPTEVVARSKEILSNLERGEFDDEGVPKISVPKGKCSDMPLKQSQQMSLFIHPAEHIFEEIRSMDISSMTPLDALNRLSRFKEEVK
ncbi:MAG: DNA mismatch repair protein MutS [Proteobacteria bacterium]|nr:DNA mismatch repair protein MutS [Pseudomonadota bacterium]